MTDFKVGDKVRALCVCDWAWNYSNGTVYEGRLVELDNNFIHVKLHDDSDGRYWIFNRHHRECGLAFTNLEKIEETGEEGMNTFKDGEKVQGVIDMDGLNEDQVQTLEAIKALMKGEEIQLLTSTGEWEDKIGPGVLANGSYRIKPKLKTERIFDRGHDFKPGDKGVFYYNKGVFYYIGMDGNIRLSIEGTAHPFYSHLSSIGGVFRTEQGATKRLAQMQVLGKLKMIAAEHYNEGGFYNWLCGNKWCCSGRKGDVPLSATVFKTDYAGARIALQAHGWTEEDQKTLEWDGTVEMEA